MMTQFPLNFVLYKNIFTKEKLSYYKHPFYKNVVFPAQAEYSYFSADFRLKTFLYYDISVLECIGDLNYKCSVSISVSLFVAVSEVKMSRQTTLSCL